MTCRTALFALAVLAASAQLSGCKLVKNEAGSGTPAVAGNGSKLDAMVEEMWTPRILPYLQEAAVDLATLAPAVRQDLDAAGKAHGHRKGGEGTPWSFATRFSGRIVEANTQSRAATAAVDIDGDDKADATVQLGPVIRGTALRDVLPFVDFNEFKDQIEFAAFSRALNGHADAEVLAGLPRDNLEGREISGIGAFTMRSAGDEILITPAAAELGAAP